VTSKSVKCTVFSKNIINIPPGLNHGVSFRTISRKVLSCKPSFAMHCTDRHALRRFVQMWFYITEVWATETKNCTVTFHCLMCHPVDTTPHTSYSGQQFLWHFHKRDTNYQSPMLTYQLHWSLSSYINGVAISPLSVFLSSFQKYWCICFELATTHCELLWSFLLNPCDNDEKIRRNTQSKVF